MSAIAEIRNRAAVAHFYDVVWNEWILAAAANLQRQRDATHSTVQTPYARISGTPRLR